MLTFVFSLPATSASTSRDPSGCVDTFRFFRNTLAYDGILQNNIRTSGECQAACLANAACVGLDFDNTDRMCYHHNNINDLALRNTQATGVDLYVRVPCTVGTTTTTAAPGGSK